MKKIYVVLLCMMACLMACEKDIDFGKTKLVVETNKVTPDCTSAIIECAIATDATVNEVVYLDGLVDALQLNETFGLYFVKADLLRRNFQGCFTYLECIVCKTAVKQNL